MPDTPTPETLPALKAQLAAAEAERFALTIQLSRATEATRRAFSLATCIANTWGAFARRGREQDALYQAHQNIKSTRAALAPEADGTTGVS